MQNHTILTRECVLKMLKAAGKKGKSDWARDLVCGTRVFKCIWWMYMYLLDSSKTATQGAWSGVGVPSWIFSGRRAFALWGPPWRHVMLQRCEFHCDDAAAADDDDGDDDDDDDGDGDDDDDDGDGDDDDDDHDGDDDDDDDGDDVDDIPDHYFNGAEPSGLVELWSGA